MNKLSFSSVTLLSTAFVSLGATNADAVSFSVMGEIHTGNKLFSIYNNGLLDANYNDGSIVLGGKTYGKANWKISQVQIDFTGTNTVINGTPTFKSGWTNVHYKGDGTNSNTGSTYTSTNNVALLGYTGVNLNSTNDLVTFNFNSLPSGETFDFGESITFNVTYADKSNPSAPNALTASDLNNFRVTFSFVTDDGLWGNDLVYQGDSYSPKSKKASFPFDGKIIDKRPYAYLGSDLTGEGDFQYYGSAAAVPEPLTVLGTLTALGLGTLLKTKGKKTAVENVMPR